MMKLILFTRKVAMQQPSLNVEGFLRMTGIHTSMASGVHQYSLIDICKVTIKIE